MDKIDIIKIMKTVLYRKIFFFMFVWICAVYLFHHNLTPNNKIIKLGSSLPLSGITKRIGLSVRDGANVYFRYANEKKLLGDYSIEFICYDDKYEPELTKDNLKKLLTDDQVFSLFGFVGTPTIKSVLPIIDDHDTPFIAPFTGASFLRKKARKNFINFRASYQEEIEKILKYLIYTKKLTRFSIFYQSDDYGDEGYIATINALNKVDLKLVSDGTYKRNTISIQQALTSIREAKPEAIIMVGSYKPVAHFVKKYRELGLENTLFCNLSFVDADALVSELEFKTKNIIFSQIVPSYNNRTIPIIVEYQKLMNRYAPSVEFGFVSLEAFLSAKISVYALSQMSDKSDKELFIKKLQQIKGDVLEGLYLRYKDRQLSHNVYLFEHKNYNFSLINEYSFE